MVRAILDGSKTQTRRVVKLPRAVSEPVALERMVDYFDDDGVPYRSVVFGVQGAWMSAVTSPYGTVGDRMWVRETHAIVPATAYRCSTGIQQTVNQRDTYEAAIYREGFDLSTGGLRWRPSIFMPRWASRITLEIRGVRVGRLQDISEADAIAEGCHDSEGAPTQELSGTSRGAYALLWDEINGKRAPWSSNPWVWVVEFARAAA